jgi:1-acyl-sn-glycerol-3-phosphate acyltransferase
MVTWIYIQKGAFNVAAKGNVPVVPIALIGTGKLMPNGLESTLRPGKVTVVIHPRIQGGTVDELCTRTRDVIAQTIKKYGLPVA